MPAEATAALALVATALLVFALGVAQRLRQVLQGRRLAGTGTPGARLGRLLLDGLLQPRMLRDPITAAAHFVFVVGLPVLAVRTLTLLGRALHPEFHLLGFSPALTSWFPPVLEAAELALLMAVGYALLRRWVLKPWALSRSFRAEAVLFFIALLVAADLLQSAAVAALPRAAVSERAWLIPLLAGVLRGAEVGPTQLASWQTLGFWLHLLGAAGLLAYLPFSVQGHVLWAPVSIALANLRPGREPAIPEGETAGFAGFADFPRSHLLDLHTCTECGRCMTNCPTALTEKALRPKELLERLGRALRRGNPAPADAAGHASIWDCTTCGACEERCPVRIEVVSPILGMRRHLVAGNEAPPAVGQVLEQVRRTGSPYPATPPSGERWGLPLAGDAATEYLFVAGCAARNDPRARRAARAAGALFAAAEVSMATLGDDEPCCGDVARRLGDEEGFATTAHAAFKRLGATPHTTLVTFCAHCLQSFGHAWPTLGLRPRVIHYTELLARLVREKRLVPSQPVDEAVAVHDPCYLARINDETATLRFLLDAIPGLRRHEMERSGRQTFCCGGGGGHHWLPEAAPTIAHQRLTEAGTTNAALLATACPYCLVQLDNCIAEPTNEHMLTMQDVSELLARSCALETTDPTRAD